VEAAPAEPEKEEEEKTAEPELTEEQKQAERDEMKAKQLKRAKKVVKALASPDTE
jgi:hypothetical protein